MADKRKAVRYFKRLKLRFGTEQPSFIAYTDEVSATGISIRTRAVLPPGSMVVIELYASDDTAILLKGRVMWSKLVPAPLVRQAEKAGMGIRILQILSGGEKFYQLCSERLVSKMNTAQGAGHNESA